MALGSFAEGFAKGFASTYAIKLQEQKEERLLKKTFLQEQRKKREEAEARANGDHDVAKGLQQAYGLTQSQTNSLFFNLNKDLVSREDITGMAEKFAQQNKIDAMRGISSPSKDKTVNQTPEAVVEQTDKLFGITSTQANLARDLAKDEEGGDIPAASKTAQPDTYRTFTTPSLGYAGGSLTTYDTDANQYFANVFSGDNSGTLMAAINKNYLDPDYVSKQYSGELLKVANEARNNGRIKFASDEEKELVLSAIEENPSIIGEKLKTVIPAAEMPGQVVGTPADVRKSTREYKKRMLDAGMSQEFTDWSGSMREDAAQRFLDIAQVVETPDFIAEEAGVDVRAQDEDIKERTRTKAVDILLRHPDVQREWANHLARSEYNKFMEEGNPDKLAKAKALLSYVAGPEYAAAWDGTDENLKGITSVLRKDKGPILKDKDGNWQQVSQQEGVLRYFAQAREAGGIPTEQDILSQEVKQKAIDSTAYIGQSRSQFRLTPNGKLTTMAQMEQEALIDAETDREDELAFMPAKADAASTEARVRSIGGEQSQLIQPVVTAKVKTDAKTDPSRVGYKTLNLPYADAGLARLPNTLEALTALDLKSWNSMSDATVRAAIKHANSRAVLYRENGFVQESEQATLEAAALQSLVDERQGSPDAYLTSDFVGKEPKQIADFMFRLQQDIATLPEDSRKRQLAERRLENMQDYLTFSPPSKFNFEDYQTNPTVYSAYLQYTNPTEFSKFKPFLSSQAKTDLLKDLDLSKLTTVESVPMLSLYLQTADSMIQTTTDKTKLNKLRFTREQIKAQLKGIKEANPDKLDLNVLKNNALLAYTRVRDAREQVAQTDAEQAGGAILTENLYALQQAQVEYRSSMDILNEAKNIERIFSPEKTGETLYVGSLAKATSAVIRAENELAEANASGTEAQKETARRNLQTAREVEKRLWENETLKAQLKVKTESPNIEVFDTSGERVIISRENAQEEGYYPVPETYDEWLNMYKADTASRERLSTTVGNVERLMPQGARLINTVKNNPDVLTAAGGLSSFITQTSRDLQGITNLFADNGIPEENRIPGVDDPSTFRVTETTATNLSNRIRNSITPQMGKLAEEKAKLTAELILFVYRSGAVEGQSGTALSNKDFQMLLNSFEGGNNPDVFIRNIQTYTNDAIKSGQAAVDKFNQTSNTAKIFEDLPIDPAIKDKVRSRFEFPSLNTASAGQGLMQAPRVNLQKTVGDLVNRIRPVGFSTDNGVSVTNKIMSQLQFVSSTVRDGRKSKEDASRLAVDNFVINYGMSKEDAQSLVDLSLRDL